MVAPREKAPLQSGPGLETLGLTLNQAASFCLSPDGQGLGGAKGAMLPDFGEAGRQSVTKVVLDSRLAGPGAIFVAIRGENGDGHDYVGQALDKGALAAVVHGEKVFGCLEEKLIRVDDTVLALGNLARSVRLKIGAKIVAVTGSVGKTTVKEMIKNILESEYGEEEILVTSGNFNNHLGVPLTLLSQSVKTKVGVVELGANHFGEIAYLTRMVRPDAGLVTRAGTGHLEFFGSVDGVAKAKGELYENLPELAAAIFNAQDERMMKRAKAFSGKKYFFAFGDGPIGDRDQTVSVRRPKKSALGGQKVLMNGPGLPEAGREFHLRLFGAHNALNAAAAAAAALALGLGWEGILKGLSKTWPLKGRLRTVNLKNHMVALDAVYNANPTSVEACLEIMRDLPKYAARCAILGDMLELGEESRDWHVKIGRRAAECGIHWLALVGNQTKLLAQGAIEGGFNANCLHETQSGENAARWLLSVAPAYSVILVIGSRGVKLEKALSELRKGHDFGGKYPGELT